MKDAVNGRAFERKATSTLLRGAIGKKEKQRKARDSAVGPYPVSRIKGTKVEVKSVRERPAGRTAGSLGQPGQPRANRGSQARGEPVVGTATASTLALQPDLQPDHLPLKA